MCRCIAQPNALHPRVEIFPEAVVVFALAWLENNNNQKEDEQPDLISDYAIISACMIAFVLPLCVFDACAVLINSL